MNKKNKSNGSILFSVLLVIFLLSSIFLFIYEDFLLETRFIRRTEDYYIAKTMENMCLIDIRAKQHQSVSIPLKGMYHFSDGNVSYSIQEKVIVFTVETKRKAQFFSTVKLE